MQIVYISNRPKTLSETIKHVELFMPFINEVVVCVPDNMMQAYENIRTQCRLNIVSENTVLTNDELAALRGLDHQRRNYLLRTRLVDLDLIEDHFIMSDDDSRPLKPIDVSVFLRQRRYRRYIYYDLANWHQNQTEFDAGQIATHAVLAYEGLNHLAYASHMPQIIDKSLFCRSTHFFSHYATQYPLCEWSSYFNYAESQSPESFHDPEPFVTLCWPEHPLAWDWQFRPAEILFENYTPSLYQVGGVFHGLDTANPSAKKLRDINIQKLILWKNYAILSRHPEQANGYSKYLNPRVWVNKLLKTRNNFR